MANKIFRFALGSPAAPLSGLWRVWTHEDEAHVAVPATLEEVGLTIYPTGRWRIMVGGVVSRWTRPKDFRPGWTRGPDLVIPHSDVPVQLPAKDAHAAEPVAWLAPPIDGYQARFSLLIATPAAEASHWRPVEAPGTQDLATLALRTAGTLHLYRRDEPVQPEDRPPAAGQPANGPVALSVIVRADQMGHPSFLEVHGAP
jgi:hypothetical protein